MSNLVVLTTTPAIGDIISGHHVIQITQDGAVFGFKGRLPSKELKELKAQADAGERPRFFKPISKFAVIKDSQAEIDNRPATPAPPVEPPAPVEASIPVEPPAAVEPSEPAPSPPATPAPYKPSAGISELTATFLRGKFDGQLTSVYKTRETNPAKAQQYIEALRVPIHVDYPNPPVISKAQAAKLIALGYPDHPFTVK